MVVNAYCGLVKLLQCFFYLDWFVLTWRKEKLTVEDASDTMHKATFPVPVMSRRTALAAKRATQMQRKNRRRKYFAKLKESMFFYVAVLGIPSLLFGLAENLFRLRAIRGDVDVFSGFNLPITMCLFVHSVIGTTILVHMFMDIVHVGHSVEVAQESKVH